jgi:glycerophosphoryl diester phosphodiesterase
MSSPLASLLAVCSFAGVSPAAEPFLVAHRGASHDAPENTLPAFELAWHQGADAIEGDFHLTADGGIVCLHDADTARTAGGRKLVVAETPLAELRKLDVGAWKGERWKGTPPPTLAEVLDTVPAGKTIYIEVKCGPEIVPALARDLAGSRLRPTQVVIISFQEAVIREVKARGLPGRANWLTGLPGHKQQPLAELVPGVVRTARASGADGVGVQGLGGIDEAFVGALRQAGLAFHVWTVDDPAAAARFLRLGAASVTTNRPRFLRDALQAAKR